ncbi:hypothetical protein SK128_012705 [Halocaridina rubra]|uniref:Uncharacterized protein n=1 Tax=Halocaridina rubra TaxID=373956 RepID=A0AAN8WNW6_HALRR
MENINSDDHNLSEDSDDEWFYDSFKRYDELLMYDVQGNITCGAFLNGNKLLLTASGDNRRHEVWELSIPKKLVAGKDAGLTKDRDFKIITAGYSGHKVKQV